MELVSFICRAEPKISFHQAAGSTEQGTGEELLVFDSVCKNPDLTPLYWAVCGKQDTEVEKLLQQGANANDVNYENRTVLHVALSHNAGVKVVRSLLRHGADPNAIDHSGNAPIHLTKDVECIKELVKHGANIDARDRFGDSVLHSAVKCENLEYVAALLHQGAGVNLGNLQHRTPLHEALILKDLKMVRALLRHGADVNLGDNAGCTPLHLGVTHGAPMECIKELLEHGARVDVANYQRQTPLHETLDHVPLAQLLIKYALIHSFLRVSRDINVEQCIRLPNIYALACYAKECISELAKMETMKVNERFSLYTFIATQNPQIPLYKQNENTQNFIRDVTPFEDFPVYGDIVQSRINLALERGRFLEKLKEVCVYCRSNNGFKNLRRARLIKTYGEKVMLNQYCTAHIASFLVNEDLCKMMTAFCKRESHPCAKLHHIKNGSSLLGVGGSFDPDGDWYVRSRAAKRPRLSGILERLNMEAERWSANF